MALVVSVTMDMPTPKLLTPDSFPTICPVFRAASHGEALDLADYHFRQDGVEAALWYREPIGLDWDIIWKDKQLLLRACAERDIQPEENSMASESKEKLAIHYDRYLPDGINPDYFFFRSKTRALILRTPFNELGTIIFEQTESRFNHFVDSDDDYWGEASQYKEKFGKPWQVGSHSMLFIKSTYFGEGQALLHVEPTYDLTNSGYKRHIDIIDLDCYDAIRPSLPLPLPPIA